MKHTYQILVIFLSIWFVQSQLFTDSGNCQFRDPNGNVFNLNSLKKSDYWKVKDSTSSSDTSVFSMDYLFNFCESPVSKCHGSNVGAFEALVVLGQQTDTCEVLGRQSATSVQYIEKSEPEQGIRVTYSKGNLLIQGDLCANSENSAQNGLPRKINFNIICDSSQEQNFVQKKFDGHTITKCNMQFNIKSPVGCVNSTGFFHSIWLFITYVFYGCIFYLLALTAYNMKYKNQSIFMAIPHKDLISIDSLSKYRQKGELLDRILQKANKGSFSTHGQKNQRSGYQVI